MKEQKQLITIALDGVPFSLLTELLEQGVMPHFAELVASAKLKSINSVHPPISSVAWASFLTGEKPAVHGITGFLERDPATWEWFVPNASHLKKATLLQELSDSGNRVFSMNVPVTYPPAKVNGIVISGFLNNDLTKATYPPAIGMFLKTRGYRIDADVELGKQDLAKFYPQLLEIMKKRFELLNYFYEKEDWHFFMGHIMETDRLHHFFWKYYKDKQEPMASQFIDFYRQLDEQLGQFLKKVKKQSALMLLSDHGFTELKYEVNLNRWLMEQGYLFFKEAPPKNLNDLHEFTSAYSLYPGRIYINLKGREKLGKVNPGVEYENLCNQLKQKLLQLKAPDGQPVIADVVRGYQVYGLPTAEENALFVDATQLKNVPDLLAIPNNGYDLKGVLWANNVFRQTEFNGTHTFNDAFLLLKNFRTTKEASDIREVNQLIKSYFDES